MFTLLILINSLATGLYVILSTRLVRKTGWNVSDVLAGSHLIASMGLAIVVSAGVPPGPVDPYTLWLIGASVLLKACSKWLYFSALSTGDVAPLSFISAVVPLVGGAFAYLITGQTHSLIDIFGTLAAVVLLLLSLKTEQRSARKRPDDWTRSVKDWTMGVFSALANGLSAVVLMMAVVRLAPPQVSFLNTTVVALIFTVYSVSPGAQDRRGGTTFPRMFRSPELWIISLCFLLSHLTHTYLFTLAPVGLVLALERLNIFIQVILARSILGERDSFRSRLLCASCLIGIAFFTQVLKS